MSASSKLRHFCKVISAAIEKAKAAAVGCRCCYSRSLCKAADHSVLTHFIQRRIRLYLQNTRDAALAKRDTKAKHLERQGALNRHPERVLASWFQANGFFEARDLVQVKYEMLRQVSIDGV